MPTYEYVCLSCARRVDVLHGIHVDGPSTCEVCGGQLRKAISAAAVVFKGSGWAKKDAARAAARPSTDKAGSDGSTTDSEHPKDKTPVAGSEPDTARPSTPDGKAGTSDKAPTKDPGSTASATGAKGQKAGTGERGSASPRSGE